MYVINRRNEREAIRYDKITDRNIVLSEGLNVDASYLSKLVIESLKSGMTTTEIDELAAETAFYMSTYEPDYDVLATRISVSNLHKQTSSSFYETVKKMYYYIDEKSSKKSNVISNDFMKFVEDNKDELDSIVDYSRDFNYNYFGFKTLTRMYLNKLNGVIVERPQHMLMRVAVCIHLNDIKSIRESYTEMSLGKFTHASPTLFNAGSSKPQLASCFLLKCEDDLSHIYETNKRSALISKHGGGIGIDITNIRSKGSVIHSTNGKSDGLVPMCKVFNATCNYCNQSGKRKGSIAMYLQPWHPDIFDFLALRYNNPPEELRARDLFTAMWIPDIFMRRVERDEMWSLFDPNVVRELCDTYGEEFDKIYEIAEKEKKYVKRVKARDVFKEIIHSQQETGLPYISYKDNINRKSNQKNIGLIRSSNLCVSGDTKILTTEGHIEIKNLVDKEVSVWNGLEWSKTTVRKTGENQELVSVTLSNGETIKCTPYHKFPIVEGYQHTKYNFAKQKFTMIEAKNLVKNMKLAKYLLPNNINVSSNYDLKYPYTEGMFTGDGTYENKEKTTAKITLYHDKIKLYDLLDKRRETTNQSNPLKKDVYLPLDISPKYTVPHDKSSVFCKVAWLAGLVDSDGVLTNNAGSYSIQICSIDKQFLLKIRLMLQTIGVDTKVTRMSKAGKRLMPDGKGGKDYYDCKESFRLLIPFQELNDLIRLGFETHRIDLSDIGIPNRSSSHFIKIENVTSIEGKYDTYCFTEPKRNMGMFNGVMLGNCNEINEFTDTNSVAVCNLASLSLPSFVKEKEDGSKYYDFMELGRITKIAIRNLNKVIDRTYYPVKEAETNNLSYRPIGLGIQGLADVFAMFRTTWENSSLSKALNQLILEVVYYYALETSHEIAMENGSYDSFEGSPISEGILQFDMWDVNPMTLKGQKIFGEVLKLDWEGLKEKCKKGVRNSLLIALMPTATSSQILGNNEAFEPFTSNIYTRSTISGDFIMVNKHLAKHLKELNLWSKDMVNKIIENNGSIQGIKEIPVNVREIYKTVWEISQKIIIDFAADRGAFVDQSQSMNIFMEQPSYAKLSSMHLYGWKKGLKTGSYYIRSKPSRNAVKFTILRESDTEGKESEVEEKKEGKKYILNGKEMICNDDVCTMCSA